MAYLIDGHNLIPKLGLRLDALDDESDLVSILQEFGRLSRQRIEVYFDGAPAGQAGTRRLGGVTAHFVARRSTADAAIKARLATDGRAARNWTVVSSDRAVQAEARAAGASVLKSDEFARRVRLQVPPRRRAGKPAALKGTAVSAHEVEEWLEAFRRRK